MKTGNALFAIIALGEQDMKSKEGCNEYIKTVKPFLVFIQRYGFKLDVLRSYKKVLAEYSDKTASTKNVYLSAAKAILKQAVRERIVPAAVLDEVRNFKVESGHKKDGLKQDEVKEILSYIPTIRLERRRLTVAAMVQLLAFAGLRQKELVGLKVKDVDMRTSKIWVTGKGSDDKQAVPVLRESVKEAIQALIEYRGLCADDYLFSQLHDKKAAVSAAYVRQLFTEPNKGVFARAGVHGQGLHGFRHFCFSYMATAGYTLEQIMAVSRHKNAYTVQVYIDKGEKNAIQ